MNSSMASSGGARAPLPFAARTALAALRRLRHGSVTLELPDGSVQVFGEAGGPATQLTLLDWTACHATLKSGDIGFAESYIAGTWSSTDLAALLKLLLANRQAIESLIHGTWMGRALYRVRHLLHRNTRTNSRRNIHAHYDLGNAFYALWLDDTMSYSSAWFQGKPDGGLREAQHAKTRRALRMCGVPQGGRLLEIGCGWGALAEMAASEFGATVTAVTLSTEQLSFARQRMRRRGVAQQADLRLQDYRDIDDEPFDAICSIEMVEAVGREYWPAYFSTLSRLLKPGARACVQSIVIDDKLFDRYVRSTDFIQQYIFPGGCLPCPREFRTHADRAGLKIVDEFRFGQDYAETLRRWRSVFLEARPEVLRQGFDERFIRLWEFYLAYCEAAFTQGDVDVVQYTLEKRG